MKSRPLLTGDATNLPNNLTMSLPEREKSSTPRPVFPKPLSLSELSALTLESPPWAVESLFESGTVNMISAAPNQYKSWIALHIAVCLASGTPVFGHFAVERQPVFVWNEEDGPRILKQRLAMLSPSPDLPIYIYASQGIRLDEKTVVGMVEEMKERNARFLIVDSFISVHGAEENNSKEMQAVMERFKDITRDSLTVLTCHHHRKGANREEGNPLGEEARGSSAIVAALHSHLSCRPAVTESDASRIIRISQPKQKCAEKLAPFRVRFAIKDDMATLIYDGESKADTNAAKTAEQVLAFLKGAGRWVPTKEVVAAKVAGEKATQEALREMERDGRVTSKTRNELRAAGLEPAASGQHNEKCYRAADSDEAILPLVGCPPDP